MPSKNKKTTFKKKIPGRKSKGQEAAVVSKEMTFGEVINKFPSAVPVMFEYGLHCIGCHVSAFETIEQGATAHGLSEEQLNEMIEKMNKTIKNKE